MPGRNLTLQVLDVLVRRDINDRRSFPHERVTPGVDCCECLFVLASGDQVEIVCNECGAVTRAVAVGDVERVMSELAQTDTICSARCPHCGEVNTFPGFSTIEASVCSHCGECRRRPKGRVPELIHQFHSTLDALRLMVPRQLCLRAIG